MFRLFGSQVLGRGRIYLGEIKAFQPIETRVEDTHATNILRGVRVEM